MALKCPKCQAAIQLSAPPPSGSIQCLSCGATIRLKPGKIDPAKPAAQKPPDPPPPPSAIAEIKKEPKPEAPHDTDAPSSIAAGEGWEVAKPRQEVRRATNEEAAREIRLRERELALRERELELRERERQVPSRREADYERPREREPIQQEVHVHVQSHTNVQNRASGGSFLGGCLKVFFVLALLSALGWLIIFVICAGACNSIDKANRNLETGQKSGMSPSKAAPSKSTDPADSRKKDSPVGKTKEEANPKSQPPN